MRYREMRPGPPLDRFLECIWFADDDAPRRALPPSGSSPTAARS